MAYADVVRIAPMSAPSSNLFRQAWAAITRAREAQAKMRQSSQLRDLPDNVLNDIGVPSRESSRLRSGRALDGLLGP